MSYLTCVVQSTKPVDMGMGPMKTLEKSSGLTCCVTSETYKRTFGFVRTLCHMSDEQTDNRVCDDDVSQAKRTYGRTVSDGKWTDGYRSLLFAKKMVTRSRMEFG